MAELTHIIAKYSPEPGFLLLIIFLFSFGKSVIFISSLLPPASITLMLGVVAGKPVLADGYVWGAIALGAMLGSVLSFHCGALLQGREHGKWLPARYHSALNKAKSALLQKGVALLFISRFLAVMRYTVPLVAGMISLSRKQVYCASALSAGIWAVALMSLGHMIPAT